MITQHNMFQVNDNTTYVPTIIQTKHSKVTYKRNKQCLTNLCKNQMFLVFRQHEKRL